MIYPIRIDLYGTVVDLCICGRDAMQRRMLRVYRDRDKLPIDCAGMTMRYLLGDGVYHYAVWFDDPANATPDNVAHECTHAAIFVLADHGIGHSKTNSDPLAYLVGYLVGQAMRRITGKGR